MPDIATLIRFWESIVKDKALLASSTAILIQDTIEKLARLEGLEK